MQNRANQCKTGSTWAKKGKPGPYGPTRAKWGQPQQIEANQALLRLLYECPSDEQEVKAQKSFVF